MQQNAFLLSCSYYLIVTTQIPYVMGGGSGLLRIGNTVRSRAVVKFPPPPQGRRKTLCERRGSRRRLLSNLAHCEQGYRGASVAWLGLDYEEVRCDHGGDSGGCSQRCHGPGGWVREARW